MTRAIRGAITIDNDTVEDIKSATVEMLKKITELNSVNISDIVYTEFTVTGDIKSATPAKFARTELGWNTVPLMCCREFEFDGGLINCIRVLVVINSDKSQTEIMHVYIRIAANLRKDLMQS